MTVRFEAIKPPKFDSAAFVARLRWAVSQTIKDAKRDFESTCKDFDHQPTFVVEEEETAAHISSVVYTTNKNYARLVRGVKGGYKIPKAGPGLLVFRRGYKAKTRPGILKSRPGGSYGELVFIYKQITAKGFPGRPFPKLVKIKTEPWLKQRVRVAYREAARASGHGKK